MPRRRIRRICFPREVPCGSSSTSLLPAAQKPQEPTEPLAVGGEPSGPRVLREEQQLPQAAPEELLVARAVPAASPL
jgi:hypothetical protein